MSDEVTIGEGPAFERELPKQGSCAARVWKSFSVGLQAFKGGAPAPKVVLYFILPYKYTTGDFKGKRMLIHQMYTAGFGKGDTKKPTWLRRDVQAILNRHLTDEEIKAGFKMNREVAGAPCLVQVVHENGYANVGTVMSIPDGMPVFPLDSLADPAPDYVPSYVTKLLEKRIVQERDTSDAPPPEKPTKEEEDAMAQIF